MNKAQFAEIVKEKGKYKTAAEAHNAIESVIDSIKNVISAKEEIAFIGFCSFSTVLQSSKSGKVPGTDRTYTTQERMVPKVKFSKTFKESVAVVK